MTEPGVVALHVDDVPLRAVVDQVAGGGLVVVPVLGGDISRLIADYLLPWKPQAAPNRTFPCIMMLLGKLSHHIKNQLKASQVVGFGCLESVFYGIRDLA